VTIFVFEEIRQNTVFDRKLRVLVSSVLETECILLACVVEGNSEIYAPTPGGAAVPHIILHLENFALKTCVFDRK